MTKTVNVSAYTRRPPEKKLDPLAPEMEAKRRRFQSKWGIEVVSANDERLAKPLPDPVPGPGFMSLEKHKGLLRSIARMMGRH
jgi:hypothetical protein